eukprot:10400091-Heterocapsa_arctica.AAC.1
MEFDLDGEEYINLIAEAADRNAWGGARQVAMCARMAKFRVDIHSFGNMVQTFEFDNNEDDTKRIISLLWCNLNKRGEHPNHYDLVHPIIHKEVIGKSFK